MARKLASLFYEVTPTERLMVTISGPDDPFVAFDDMSLEVSEGVAFALTPQMFSGVGAHHVLNVILLFPVDDEPGPGFRIKIAGPDGKTLDIFKKSTPDIENTAKVQIMIRVR